MSYVRGFLPWIGFIALSQFGWQWGAAGAAVLAVAMLVRDRRAGASWDTQVLAIGAIAFFAVLTPIAFAAPDAAIGDYTGSMSTAWLALVAWVSIAVGTPFTMGLARQETTAEVWDSPIFHRVNAVITAVWASAFTMSAVASVVMDDQPVWAHVVTSAAFFVAPMVFTRMYVARVRARTAAPLDDAPTLHLSNRAPLASGARS